MDTTEQKENQPFSMKGNWNDQSKKLMEKFPDLLESDLKYESGKEKELLGRISTRLNKNTQEVISIIKKEQPNNL